ncbi:MAG: hypothetical protein HGB23_02270 [Chlorobiaceae bacterium]|nr:hypothetical protein [Chlorobiaceae bacterium]
MIDFDEIKRYLPTYLNPESKLDLMKSLKDFPNNIDKRMYSLRSDDIVYQGDGLEGLLLINLPDTKIVKSRGMIISNTCDSDLRNQRPAALSLCYAPIVSLDKYISKLREFRVADEERIQAFLASIKKQLITQIFYLTSPSPTLGDSIVLFDKINSCHNESVDRSDLNKQRLFSLSNYGFYLFLTKLSIHFTRVNESIDRNL